MRARGDAKGEQQSQRKSEQGVHDVRETGFGPMSSRDVWKDYRPFIFI